MLTIKIDIDQEAYEQLVDQAVSVRRPTPRHAGFVIRQALGLPFLSETRETKTTAPAEPATAR